MSPIASSLLDKRGSSAGSASLMGMSVILRVVLCALLFYPMFVVANEPLVAVVENLDEPFDLAPFIETIEDPHHEYTLEDIQSGQYDDLWQANRDSTFIGHNFNSKYWFRFSFQWRGESAENGMLSLHTLPALFFSAALVLPDQGDKPEQTVEVGMLHPFGSRMLPTHRYTFPLVLKEQAPLVFVGWVDNHKTAVPVQLPWVIFSQDDFVAEKQMQSSVLVAFYTLVFVLFVYNSCLFFLLREPIHGYYLVWLVSIAFSCASLDGTASRYLWPNQPDVLVRVLTVNGVVSALTYFLFVVSALGGIQRWAFYNKVVYGAVALGVVAFVFNLFASDSQVTTIVGQVYAALILPLALIIVVRAAINRSPTALYLLIAEGIMFAGTLSLLLSVQGLVPLHPMNVWGVHWGAGGEALMLSLALAARSRILQQAAIKNLSKYESLYKDSVEGLFQYDIKSGKLRCNNAFARIFGFENASALPTDSNLVSYFSSEIQQEVNDKLLKEGYLKNFETETLDAPSGGKKWVSITVRTEKDKQGALIRTEGSVIDISERKLKEKAELEHVFAQKKEEISEARNKAKTQFFASMSHEFRTPLTAILGYTDIAQDKSLGEQERIAHIKTIETSTEHMLQLINDVLDLSKIEAQKLDVEAIELDLFTLGQQLYDFVWILATQKGISFDIDYQLPLPETFISDPTRLKQALINLCSNAIKFTQEGGVTLRIACDLETEFLSFAVIDTGVGMHPDEQTHLFNAFTQADSSTSRHYGGTGLGLHLSQLIANKLGGGITVESTYGEGSTFVLKVKSGPLDKVAFVREQKKGALIDDRHSELGAKSPSELKNLNPVAESLHETDREPKPESKPNPKPESKAEARGATEQSISALVVDDNEVNQQLMSILLKKKGVEVMIASDGLEAIASALRDKPTVIFMDLEMPMMDGLTTVKHLRKKGIDIPIYALTGNVSAETIKECKKVGCDGHLEKPVNKGKFFSLVDSIIEARKG